MGFATKAFDFFYKRFGPTGSLPQDWYDKNSTSGYNDGSAIPLFARVSKSFLNFPEDGQQVAGIQDNDPGTTTVCWTTTKDSASNATYVALPWGSAAGDFLWNALTPSWSFVTGTDIEYPFGYTLWYTTYTSKSFFSREWSKQILYTYQKGSDYGLVTASGAFTSTTASAYAVTSSWKAFDPKIYEGGGSIQYTQVGQPNVFNGFGYSMTWPAVNSTSTSSVDNQYFDQSGGVGITRTEISQSLVTASAYATDNSATGLRYKTEALKARRLYFPVPYSGSGTTRGTDYWFKYITGKRADSIFYDNGGIYNVQFSLKRYPPVDYVPDLGSFMTAFIHNVVPQIPSSANCIEGASGWYPPANNIVTIGNQYNGTSALSFFDIQTGFYVEKFNFNLIQYGYPAQLCLEVSGSLADNTYFGIIVDEFKMCKIGVTTDPRFIKPTSIATAVIDLGQQAFINAGGSNPLFDGG